MKAEDEIKEKIAEHQKWIDSLLNSTEERDDSFWFDLQRLRNGQKALEWVICPNPFLEQTDIDRMLEWESTCKYASRIF